MLIWAVVLIILGASSYWAYSLYLHMTEPVPDYGGKYTEGMVGQPTYINPLLSQVSEVDSDLTQLLYDGLFRFDVQGEIVPNIAEEWDVSEDHRTYTVYLKQDVKWHDGEEVLADDAMFTYERIQNATYKSPLRFLWQDVNIEQADEYTLVFRLEEPSFGFLENLVVGLLPKHIWENIGSDRFTLSKFNIEPIGSGPYMFKESQKDSDGNILVYELQAFDQYHNGQPFISDFVAQFYVDKDSLIKAIRNKEVLGVSSIDQRHLSKEENLTEYVTIHSASIPHYFAVFFNQTKSVPLAYDEVRKALTLAVNRKDILEKVLEGSGDEVQSLFLPGTPGFKRDVLDAQNNTEEAKKTLEEKGWSEQEDGIRKKEDVRLEFTLMLPDWPEAVETASILKEQWRQVGAQVNLQTVSVYELGQNYIQPREYDALLFANVTSLKADPFVFWHSDQKKDPGRNFALFEDEDADNLLIEAKKTVDDDKRGDLYKQWQDIVNKKHPAVYLFSPKYLYLVSPKIQGIQLERITNPADRLSQIETWYIKTKRIFKD